MKKQMEEKILQEIKEINSELESIDKKLSSITYKLNCNSRFHRDCKYLEDEKQEYDRCLSKLFALRKKKWKKLYEEKLKLFPNILDNPVMKEILKDDYEKNYCFLKLVEKAPSIYTDIEQTSAVYQYITDNHADVFPNIYLIDHLIKLDARVFENPDFKTVITEVAFDCVRHVFGTPELVDNNDFISYFIKYMKENWRWGYIFNKELTKEMVQGLQSHLDYEFVTNLVSEGFLKEYLKKHMSEDLLGKIAAIQNQSLKNYILSHIFGFGNKTLTILSKFLVFPEIRKQLFDENSLYYYMLVKLATPDDDTEDYGTKAALFSFRNRDIFDALECEFDLMVHYFDFLVEHYIYFYSKGKVYQVPLLAYIKNCRKRIDYYIHIDMLVHSIDITDDEFEKLEKKHHNLLHSSFRDLCMQALSKSTRETLTPAQIDEWNHLLEIASTEIEDDNFSKVKEY